MGDSKSKSSFLDGAIRGLYQFMLLAGLVIVAGAVYPIMEGTLEAIFMVFPGLLTLGGGIVLRNLSNAK